MPLNFSFGSDNELIDNLREWCTQLVVVRDLEVSLPVEEIESFVWSLIRNEMQRTGQLDGAESRVSVDTNQHANEHGGLADGH
jgi:hypothetical protein